MKTNQVKTSLIVIWSLIFVRAANAEPEKTIPPGDKNSLKVELYLDDNVLVPWEPVFATVTLTNVSDHPVRVNSFPLSSTKILAAFEQGQFNFSGFYFPTNLWGNSKDQLILNSGHNVRSNLLLFPYTSAKGETDTRIAFKKPGLYKCKTSVTLFDDSGLQDDAHARIVESETVEVKVVTPNPDDEAVALQLQAQNSGIASRWGRLSQPDLLEQAVKEHPQSRLSDVCHFLLMFQCWLVSRPEKMVEHFKAMSKSHPMLHLHAIKFAVDSMKDIDKLSNIPFGELADELEQHQAQWKYLQGYAYSCPDREGDANSNDYENEVLLISATLQEMRHRVDMLRALEKKTQ